MTLLPRKGRGERYRVVPGPYTKEWRETWLRRVLEAQESVRQNGPAEFRELTLITPAELHEIRRIWLYEKHEFDDRLPRIYTISKQRLSEGEKQIFAISVLWGLARASARPLPAVIDTPMARLDVAHRTHLVERYFPNASHQVVIFSTDTEVDRHYYEVLGPFIARAYHLNYDEEQRRTVGEEGYFW